MSLCGIKKVLLVMVLAMFSSSSVSLYAMSLQEYDSLSWYDRAQYLEVLLDEAVRLLTELGQEEKAIAIRKLFSNRNPGEQMSQGMLQFIKNLETARRLNQKNRTRTFYVEPVMRFTLKQNNIHLPSKFMKVASH